MFSHAVLAMIYCIILLCMLAHLEALYTCLFIHTLTRLKSFRSLFAVKSVCSFIYVLILDAICIRSQIRRNIVSADVPSKLRHFFAFAPSRRLLASQ